VIQSLTRPAEVEQNHEHGVIIGEDGGLEVPNSITSGDLGQMLE
jgi:hypothetical protein